MNKLRYQIGSSYRRRLLDELLEKYKHVYRGSVLDIGGRDRGWFQKPKDQVNEWLFADINDDYKPDFIADVTNMHNIENERFDVVNATELFEHVEFPEKGLKECHRVLKPGGVCVISMPFLFPIHADPSDFQRWTKFKWENELKRAGFTIEALEDMGRFFTVFGDMIKTFVRVIPFKPLRWIAFAFYPLLDLVTRLDNLSIIKTRRLGNYTTGYFIIAKKA